MQPLNYNSLQLRRNVTARDVNGHTVYKQEIQDFADNYKFLRAANHAPELVKDTITQKLKQAISKGRQELEKKYDKVFFISNPSCPPKGYDAKKDGDTLMICANYINIPEGALFYFIEDANKHNEEIRKAIISAFYLLNKKMKFDLDQDCYEYYDTLENDEFLNKADELWPLDTCTEEDLLERNNYIDDFKYRKENKIELKFYPTIFHKYARKRNDLGDWLRTIWLYRKFNFFKFVPLYLMSENDVEGVCIEQQCRICLRNDSLIAEICEFMDMSWQEGGAYDLMQSVIYSETRKLREDEALNTKQLSHDFGKIWTFDITTLSFNKAFKYERSTFNYKEGQVPAKNNHVNLREQRGRRKKVVRRSGTRTR